MNVADMIIYLRRRLLALRGTSDRQAVADLLSTFKMLTRAAFDAGDKALVAVLVDLTDSARALHMGRPLNGKVPSEEMILAAAKQQARSITKAAAQAMGAAADPPAEAGTMWHPPAQTEPERTEADIQAALQAVAARDWTDYTPIRDGSTRQMRAYTTVYDELLVMHHLARHKPVWVGTFPLLLDTDNSDIAIVFSPSRLRDFMADVRQHYSTQTDFRLSWKAVNGVPTVIARFTCNGFSVELFAQPKPTTQQAAYVHMVVEARLLAIGGDAAIEGIFKLKVEGVDTETAFTRYFELETNDPHQYLLDLAKLDDDALRERVR